MTYKEIKEYVEYGCVVKSAECLYVKPTSESPTFWKWLGEIGWTKGSCDFDKCVNETEKMKNWEVAFNLD